MAIQSIVDFVRGEPATDATSFGLQQTVRALYPALGSNRPSPPVDERAYISLASKVVAVLQDRPDMTARQLFDEVDAVDFSAFQAAIHEMTLRGLLRTAGKDPKYGDPLYGLLQPAGS